MAAPKYTAPPPKASGISVRKIWKARPAGGTKTYNLALVPVGYHLINEQSLTKVAQATKGAIRIPGVEFYEDSNIAARG